MHYTREIDSPIPFGAVNFPFVIENDGNFNGKLWKLWNITNFVMLFQAVVKFLSRLVEIKI
jgi:hypothetical protein